MCKPVLNADRSGILSVDCTLGYLMEDPDARGYLEEFINRMASSAQNPMAGEMDLKESMKMAEKMTLREILAFGNTPGEIVSQIDARLRKLK